MAELCIHEVVRCVLCHEVEPKETSNSKPFVAMYEGECAECEFDIRPGDAVWYRRGLLVHLRCSTEVRHG